MKRFGIFALAAAAVLVGGSLAQASSLTTVFAGNNGQDGNMFDIQALTDLTITGWDVNLDDFQGGGQEEIEVYYRLGGYQGHENSAGDWTLLGSTVVNSAGEDNATFVNLGGLSLTAGNTYGIYITSTDSVDGLGFNYTDDDSELLDGLSEGDVFTSNSDLALTLGIGKSYAFGSTFSPRLWNGTVYYEIDNGDPNSVPTPAAFGSGLMLFGGLLLKRRRAAA